MLTTNQRLDKLAAGFIEYKACGVLDGSIWEDNVDSVATVKVCIDEEDEDGWAIDDREIIGEVILGRKSGVFMNPIVM